MQTKGQQKKDGNSMPPINLPENSSGNELGGKLSSRGSLLKEVGPSQPLAACEPKQKTKAHSVGQTVGPSQPNEPHQTSDANSLVAQTVGPSLPDEPHQIRQASFSGLSMVVPVKINGIRTLATVDTAAQKTIISKDLYSKLDPVRRGKEVHLCNAEKDKTMTGFHLPSLTIELGANTYTWDVIVAPISNQVLLGIDFLKHLHIIVDLSQNALCLGKEIIPAKLRRNNKGQEYAVSRVIIKKRVTLHPHSVKSVTVSMAGPSDITFVVEPTTYNKGLLMGAGILPTGEHQFIDIVNDSDKFITLKSGHCCGTGTQLDDFVKEDHTNNNPQEKNTHVVRVSAVKTDEALVERKAATVGPSQHDCSEVPQGKTEPGERKKASPGKAAGATPPDKPINAVEGKILSRLPGHTKDSYLEAAPNLNSSQQKALATVLASYQDVFAKHKYDLGKFKSLEHKIDLEDPKPFKERIRRTPLRFQEQEEKLIKHMVEAGVIQPSESPWCSAPVLFRKKMTMTRNRQIRLIA